MIGDGVSCFAPDKIKEFDLGTFITVYNDFAEAQDGESLWQIYESEIPESRQQTCTNAATSLLQHYGQPGKHPGAPQDDDE